MREYRRLPPLLRVMRIVGALFVLADIPLMINFFVTSHSSSLQASRDSTRVLYIASDLVFLGVACVIIGTGYRTHLRRPALGPFPLDSWQRQVRALLLLWALPLGGIALALLIPPTSATFGIEYPLLLLTGTVLIALCLAGAIGGGHGTGADWPPIG